MIWLWQFQMTHRYNFMMNKTMSQFNLDLTNMVKKISSYLFPFFLTFVFVNLLIAGKLRMREAEREFSDKRIVNRTAMSK